jgi:transcriptional regulator with PAS, ATPase and Fis domain
VNCAALPTELLESELFGHEKGAFTGAAATRIGKFEQADGGTILLDEIPEMKAPLQAKLLHVLQDAEFTRLGSNKRQTVDVRVIAATNRDLEEMIARGEFREDLYYRIKVIEVNVPSLRERRDEIMHLADFFIAKYTQKYNRPVPVVSDDLRRRLLAYKWPGNIRELENCIKRLVILQDERLVLSELKRAQKSPALAFVSAGAGGIAVAEADDLPAIDAAPEADGLAAVLDEAPTRANGPSDRQTLANVAKAASLKAERALIEQTLRDVHWNRRRAAQHLGVSYKTLLNKIKECGISRN